MGLRQQKISAAAKPAPRPVSRLDHLFDLVPAGRKGAEKSLSPSSVESVKKDIQILATRVWGNPTDAAEWLGAPHMELNGDTPESLLKTPEGAHRVENLLGALEHGFPV